MSRHRTDLREVEQSPDGRYVRVSAASRGRHETPLQQRLRVTSSDAAQCLRSTACLRQGPSLACVTELPFPLAAAVALQFDEKLGNGAFKEVYLSYDTETGKEVAWSVTHAMQARCEDTVKCTTVAHSLMLLAGRNTVEMRRLPSNEKRRIRSETEILAELQHPHIINFYHVCANGTLARAGIPPWRSLNR